MNAIELKKHVDQETNPLVFEVSLSQYISKNLKNGHINIYEAYLLSETKLALLRQGYMKPAFKRAVGYSELLRLVNIYLMSKAFGNLQSAEKFRVWIIEAKPLISEKRTHYASAAANLVVNNEDIALANLLKKYSNPNLSFDDGPYHTEEFPWSYISVESISGFGSLPPCDLSDEVINLICEIEIKYLC